MSEKLPPILEDSDMAYSIPDQPKSNAKPKMNPEMFDRKIMEQSLDLPLIWQIAGKNFQYTSRPIGYLNLIFAAFVDLGGSFDEIIGIFTQRVKFDIKEGESMFTSEDVKNHFIASGDKGINAMCRIAQLLVEPIDPLNPKAPDLANMALSLEAAKWSLDASTFSKMLNAFFDRDISESFITIKKVAGLSQN